MALICFDFPSPHRFSNRPPEFVPEFVGVTSGFGPYRICRIDRSNGQTLNGIRIIIIRDTIQTSSVLGGPPSDLDSELLRAWMPVRLSWAAGWTIIWKVGSCDITWYIPYWLVYTTFVISVVISVQSGVMYHEIWKHRRWNITWYITCDEEAHACYIACYMPRNMVWYILELCLWYTTVYINGGIYQWWYISCDITVKYNMVYTMIYHIPLHMWYTIEYTTANIGIYQCWYIQIVLYTNIGMVYTMICKPGSRNVRRALENRSARIYSASESTRPSTTSVSPLKSATST